MKTNKNVELTEAHESFLDNARREQQTLMLSILSSAGVKDEEELKFLKGGLGYLQNNALAAIEKVLTSLGSETKAVAFARAFVAGLSLGVDALEESLRRTHEDHPELFSESQKELPRSTAN